MWLADSLGMPFMNCDSKHGFLVKTIRKNESIKIEFNDEVIEIYATRATSSNRVSLKIKAPKFLKITTERYEPQRASDEL